MPRVAGSSNGGWELGPASKAALARGETLPTIGIPPEYLPAQMPDLPPVLTKAAAKNEARKQRKQRKKKQSLAEAYDEASVVAFLESELSKCELNAGVGGLGDPSPQDAATFLARFSRDLLAVIPRPSPEVKTEVVGAFRKVGWDLSRGCSLAGAPPPKAMQLCSLVNRLCRFFKVRGDPL